MLQFSSIHAVLGAAAAAALLTCAPAQAGKVGSDCTFNGIKLYGKVQFVESFPDLKVQMVNSFPDLKVQFVEHFPDKCGKWQVVNSFPDFKVQIVEHFPDIKVQSVSSFPGI